MAERPRATVRLVEESEATGRVAAIFADIKATKKIDFVPNFWRALATNPDHLELVWTRLKAIMHPEAAGPDRPARPADPRDHRAGGLGHQRLRLLRQLAHGGRPQARARRRGARRGDGGRRPVQLHQRARRRLPGRARRPPAPGLTQHGHSPDHETDRPQAGSPGDWRPGPRRHRILLLRSAFGPGPPPVAGPQRPR